LKPFQEVDMDAVVRTIAGSVGATVALVLLAACGSASGSDSGSDPTLTITSPSDGAAVGSTFEVKWNTNVELGEPDTGRDHVHVFVDGQANDYTVVGGHEFTIKGLSPGEHTVDVTLQHADHSPVGPEDEVHVDVAAGGSGPSTAPSDSASPSDDDSGYVDPGSGY
jgi:hypothetical protein